MHLRRRPRRQSPAKRVHRGRGLASKSFLARFCAKVQLPLTTEGIPCDDPEPCWPWTGYVGTNRAGLNVGYGQIRGDAVYGCRLLKAHVASHLLFNGPVPRGWDVCHACDHTVCVNPHHLYAAPHKDNMHDYIRKYGGLGRPKSPVSVGQLRLLRDGGHEPYLSETFFDEYYQCGAAPAADPEMGDGEVPF